MLSTGLHFASESTLEDYGWIRRPERVKLDLGEVRTALWAAGGNIGRAAEILMVDGTRLRRFIGMSEYLHGEWCEIREQMLDAAERNVWEALDSGDPKRMDSMAIFVLNSELGASRGFRKPNRRTRPPNRRLQLVWSDGQGVDE
jgi:hypothetical protein